EKLTTQDRDTARVNTLNRLATLHFTSAPEKARVFTNQALSLADSIQYSHGLAEAYLTEAMIFRLEGQANRDLAALITAMHLFESLNDSSGIARTYTEMGVSEHLQGDYSSARDHYTKALEWHKAVGNKLGEATTLRKIG